jgi:hypothetical protein
MDVIDLNCDMGESFGAWTMGSDAEMLKIVTSANVACGFHGGDPLVMFETVSHAKENRVGIGAHPSFFDVWGFGRRQIQGEKPEDIEKMVVYQIGALQGVARRRPPSQACQGARHLGQPRRCRSSDSACDRPCDRRNRPRADLCRDGRHRARTGGA